MNKKDLVTTGAKSLMVVGCTYCIEKFENEPFFCMVLCGLTAVVGLKVSYDSAGLCHKKIKPGITAFKNFLEARKNTLK